MSENREIKSVFHYTTAEGLKGILSTQTLWATDFQCLNDLKELRQAQDILFSIFRPILAKAIEPIRKADPEREKKAIALFGSYENSIDHEAKSLFESLLYPLRQYVFVLSFCIHSQDDFIFENGILSMWRAYGKHNAYAVEFDFEKLGDLFREEIKTFEYTIPILADVVYDYGIDHLKSRFDSHIKDLSSLAEKMVQAISEGIELPSERITTEEFSALVDILVCVKHRGFAEEDELRIAAYIQDRSGLQREGKLNQEKKIYYHSTSGFKTIPRIHIFEDLKIPLPIKRIIVGPHENKNIYAVELRDWLQKHGHDIPITISKIPFRGMQ